MFGDKPQELPHRVAFILVPDFTLMPFTSAIEPMRLANRLSGEKLYSWSVHADK
ncbi:MAG TPA: GlxA family transcriptional regulator, partial [Rhizobiales bacterium]|nr:GlxA family transcriptional regulator [Hyphomicrobiales bacterium]